MAALPWKSTCRLQMMTYIYFRSRSTCCNSFVNRRELAYLNLSFNLLVQRLVNANVSGSFDAVYRLQTCEEGGGGRESQNACNLLVYNGRLWQMEEFMHISWPSDVDSDENLCSGPYWLTGFYTTV